MTAKEQYDTFGKEINAITKELICTNAKLLLSLPIPMSYEVWCELHNYLEKIDKLELI